MRLIETLSEYRIAIRSRNLSPQTVTWYLSKLSAFLSWCHAHGIQDIEEVTPRTVRAWADSLRDGRTDGRDQYGRSTYTVRGSVMAVKTFLNWCAQEEILPTSPASRVALPKVEKKIIRTLSREQYEMLLTATSLEPYRWLQLRDRAILATLLDTGMRARELCGLTLDDLILAGDDGAYCRVHGKGNKWREVGIGQQASTLIRRYLRFRQAKSGVSAVFLSRSRKPLTPGGLDQILYRLRDWAGEENFTGVRVSAHTFRHTMAVNYLSLRLGDIHSLSLLLGHASVTTTQGYLRDFQQREARRGQSVLDRM